MEPVVRTTEEFRLRTDKLLLCHAALLDLRLFLLAILLQCQRKIRYAIKEAATQSTNSPRKLENSVHSTCRRRLPVPGIVCAYLLLVLEVLLHLQNRGHVVVEVQLFQGLLDMLSGYGLLGVLLGNLVGFRGNERDELDTALDEEVARVLGEGHARLGLQDLGDNLLDGCWAGVSWVRRCAKRAGGLPFGNDRSSLPPNSRSDMLAVVLGVCCFAPDAAWSARI